MKYEHYHIRYELQDGVKSFDVTVTKGSMVVQGEVRTGQLVALDHAWYLQREGAGGAILTNRSISYFDTDNDLGYNEHNQLTIVPASKFGLQFIEVLYLLKHITKVERTWLKRDLQQKSVARHKLETKYGVLEQLNADLRNGSVTLADVQAVLDARLAQHVPRSHQASGKEGTIEA
jgi:hypothetical protein